MSSYAYPYPCYEHSVHGHVECLKEQWNVVRLTMLMHWLLNHVSRRKKMVDHLMDTVCVENGEPSNASEGIPAELLSPAFFLSNPPCCEISLPVLAAQCLRELDNYRRGEPCTDTYGLELLRRATIQNNQEAWAWVQHCFGGLVRGWLRRNPKR